MATLELVNADGLDHDAYADLQKQAFAEILSRSGVSDRHLTGAYFRWKYRPPAGRGMIALVRDGDTLIAANAMTPLDLRLGETRLRGWQSCDTATLPRARRKGWFGACLRMLETALGPDEIFFGFPNQNSVRGFVRLGWKEKDIVGTWLNPLLLPQGPVDPGIIEIESFGNEQNAFADQLARMGRIALSRDAAYMNWRYVAHPHCEYAAFAYPAKGKQQGCSVLRTANVLGHHVALIMELWGLNPRAERILLRHAARWARRQGAKALILLDSGLSLSNGMRAGFFPVWQRLLPKKQVLMGYATSGDTAEKWMQDKWRVQTGDWDAF